MICLLNHKPVERRMLRMKWHKSRAVLLMLAVMALIGSIIFGLSSRIRVQMEQSATENVREIVQVVEAGIAEIRRNDVSTAAQLATLFDVRGDTLTQLARMCESSPFARISFVPAASESGVSSNGKEFVPSALPAGEIYAHTDSLVTDVYMSDLGAWTYTVLCPVYDTGEPAGTLYADIIMERYDNILPNSIYQGDGLIYILDAETLRFVYEPTSTKVFISGKYDLHGFLTDFGILDAQLEQDISAAIAGGKSTIARMQVDGEATYVYFWPVDRGEWYLCGIIPESSIQGEGKAVTQTIAAASILIFGAAAITFWLYSWYGRKSKKARQYQIDLFNGVAKSIEDVVLLYDCGTGKLELAFDNIERILGIDGQRLAGEAGKTPSGTFEGNQRLAEVLRPETFLEGAEISENVKWDNPRTGLRQYLKVETSYITMTGSKKCIVSILDITRDEQMQESLRASALAAQNASRVKSSFLSQMSHEIRTPMNAVVGMAQIAEAKLDDRARVKDCLQKINSSSQHLLSLINDILDISKIESQKMSLSEDWFELDGLLDDLSNMISVQAGMRGQRYVLENQAGSMELLADRTRLSQVLMNLLSNAVKYTPEGGRITFSVERNPSARDCCLLCFRIQDNGIGMSEAFQQKLFNPFEREDDPEVHAQTGTGLGLSIVQSMVSLMGGSIRVESAKGAGTTFFVDVSFKGKTAEQAVQAAAPVREACDLTGIVILLAEDNELNREIAAEFLNMANARVECAVDGVDAFELFRDSGERHFDLILMDMQMPRWDGLEATRRIRALDRADAKDVPIIAVTANAYLEDEQKCLQAGMNDHVAKPLDMQEFYQKVKKYLNIEIKR